MICKVCVIRALRKRIKKGQKKWLKSIVNADKGSTFAPATTTNVP